MRLRTVTLLSPMPAEAVKRSLQGAARHGFDFVGNDDETTFQLVRATESRNAFQPVIHGTIRPLERGSEVRLAFGLNPVIALLTTAWFFGMTASGFKKLWREPSWQAAALVLVVGLVVGLFVLVLVGGGFYPAARKAEKAISGLIQARRVET